MEDDGMIYRKHDKEDKRIVRIFLTPKGSKLKDKIEEFVLEFNGKLFKKLDLKELQIFEKVNNTIKEQVKLEINIRKNNGNS